MAVPPCLKEREASTRLVVLQRGRYSGQPATKLLLYPTTGRRHQVGGLIFRHFLWDLSPGDMNV